MTNPVGYYSLLLWPMASLLRSRHSCWDSWMRLHSLLLSKHKMWKDMWQHLHYQRCLHGHSDSKSMESLCCKWFDEDSKPEEYSWQWPLSCNLWLWCQEQMCFHQRHPLKCIWCRLLLSILLPHLSSCSGFLRHRWCNLRMGWPEHQHSSLDISGKWR